MNAPPRTPETTLAAPGAVGLGEWCVRLGLVSRARVDEALAHQDKLRQAGLQTPRLGQLLMERGWLKPDDLLRVLASQRRELRHCARCGYQLAVPAGADVRGCAACGDRLVPSPGAPVAARDGGDAIPDDVHLAARDRANRFGKYVLVRELGRGGVGRVFLAWDTLLSQYVAVKRLRMDVEPDSLEERRRMLLREARASIRLRHPGIVCVYDVGRILDEPYMSMEFVEGETLRDRFEAVTRAGGLPPYFAAPASMLRLLAEVARAADYAHTAPSPLVHCDLKPANIMIDVAGHARVLDFGLARGLKADAGERDEFISGTPAYMSPEQARGDHARMDARVDVYAFGAILYECLTGRAPFVGTPYEIVHLTLTASPERPRTALPAGARGAWAANPRIPDALESLILNCLERDADRRPGSLDDVATALDALAAASDAPPLPPSSLLSRPRRRRIPLLLAAALGLGLLLSLRTCGADAPPPRKEAAR